MNTSLWVSSRKIKDLLHSTLFGIIQKKNICVQGQIAIPEANSPGKRQIRDRPFNLKLWFFVSFRIFFSDNTRVRIFIFICRAKREFFFQSLTLGYMTKTLNQIIFFFLHQNQNIFFSNIGNQNYFLDKNHTPPSPLQVKWSFPKTTPLLPLTAFCHINTVNHRLIKN